MRFDLVLLSVLLLVPLPALRAAEKTAGPFAADTPPGKVYVYKTSNEKPRQLEVYFPPQHNPAKAKVPGVTP